VARADGRPVATIGREDHGYLTFVRPPSGFLIFLEAMPGDSRRPVGTVTFNSSATDPSILPHFQILTSRALGNGSTVICDVGPAPNAIGGVPAVVPATFGGSQAASNAINDLACRFDARSSLTACTRDPFTQTEGFTAAGTTVQFCTRIGVGAELAFLLGDTILTARVLDDLNQPGPPQSIVIRVLGN
jgi:hypothetical protein